MYFAHFFEKVQRSGFYRKRLEAFLVFLNPKSDMRALDIGCGPGALIIEIAKKVKEAVGIDYDTHMVVHAKRNARTAGVSNIEFKVARAQSLPFDNETFDLVSATSVLYLLPEPERGLKEIRRVLKRGGIAANLDPSIKMTKERIDKFIQGQNLSEFEGDALYGWLSAATNNHRFSKDYLRQLYQDCGFEVLEIVEHMDGMMLFCKGVKGV